MKKVTTLLIAGSCALSSMAQQQTSTWSQDKDMSRWTLDLNALGGGYIRNMDIANTAANYNNGVNMYTGNPSFTKGRALGGDAQIGFFFGKGRNWGIGTGIMYMREWGNLGLDSFHAEYQSTDANGNTFRQVATANGISERIKTDNFDIPLLLKYKKRFSKHWGFTADAGAIFNLQMRDEYKASGAFDYEAIYQFVNNPNGTQTAVYDAAPTPATTDFLITRAQFTKNNPTGSVQNYFAAKAEQGYMVGLGVPPNSPSRSVTYDKGSVGFLIQPSVNYFLSDHVALNIGGYYLFQPFNNANSKTYTLTDRPGDYNSIANMASHIETHSYGGNLGVRFFLGNKARPLAVTAEALNPTFCGLCNGGILVHGLEPGKNASVAYSLNGAAASRFEGVANGNGDLKVPGLCAGVYTGVQASVGKRSGAGQPVTLTEPPLRITSERHTSPDSAGKCTGTITLYGLQAGQMASVSYSLNGTAQPVFEATVAADNSVSLTGLCEGEYSAIMVKINKCSASLTTPPTITLQAPPLPEVKAAIDISTPILFDFDKSAIKPAFYPVLDEAYKDLQADNSVSLRVDGHTDAIGSAGYNIRLSDRRAMAVKNYLQTKGISADRIKTYGHGKTQPVQSNATPEGRASNRRAVMQLIKE